MGSDQSYDSLLDEAKVMYASGHDNTYIEFQFAEQGVDDSTIDKIVADINKLRKGYKKSQGVKQIILGSSFIGTAFIITFITSHSQSPIIIILSGLAITGVFILVKGVADVLGL